jgi:TolB protein
MIGAAAIAAAWVTPLLRPALSNPAPAGTDDGREWRLQNVRQLTSGGENAEAYFSADGRRLIFQSTRPDAACDQIFVMGVDGSDVRRVSSGAGRTTCGYFYPDDGHILYASTHLASADCPPKPDGSRGYVWPIYRSYDIFRARPDGSGVVRLTASDSYDAEATVGPDGRIVFTSSRDGDLEIYSMAGDGSDVRRLTNRLGPDGGPFYSPDGRQIVFRGRAYEPGRQLDDYLRLIALNLWRPTSLEVFVMDRDGGRLRQVTSLGGANFAPSWHPDGQRIIFSSNHHNPEGRDFELYLIDVDGSNLERVTYNGTFDGFPMFSPDGRRLAFASNRWGTVEGETNVFIADWADPPTTRTQEP